MQIRDKLTQIWGYPDFRPPQGEIVDAIRQQRDCLIVMPTGGGKSICFQLPALVSEGLTIVVSPLVALMENQVQELTLRLREAKSQGLGAGLLHSEVPSYQRKQTLQALTSSSLKLLYLSPETLLTPPVWERLSHPDLKIHSLILDEAHCLVHWGETFRPSYRRLGAVRAALLAHKPAGTRIGVAAFTATADPLTQQTIKRVLELTAPAEFILNPHRPNLSLQVQRVWTPRGRRAKLTSFIRQHPQQPGLVYVRTRADSEDLAQWLSLQGDATAAYHAGLSPRSRRQIEGDWLAGKLTYVVCTCAFGMGINKPDVRWIVHFQPPVLLAEYLQEIGRAGRDGKPAQALMLACEPTGWLYPEDRQRHQFFTQSVDRDYDMARGLANQIPDRGEINPIEQQFPQAAIALSLWHSVGALKWTTPFTYQRLNYPPATAWQSLQRQQREIYGQIPTYINSRGCRWQYLLTAFGSPPNHSWRCGNCDRCHESGG
jgi:ATP-dependent DNA helicase RecQ